MVDFVYSLNLYLKKVVFIKVIEYNYLFYVDVFLNMLMEMCESVVLFDEFLIVFMVEIDR